MLFSDALCAVSMLVNGLLICALISVKPMNDRFQDYPISK